MFKTTLKIFAFVLGLGSLLLGSNSCKKDAASVCCSFRDGDQEDGFHDYKVCKDSNWTTEEWTSYVDFIENDLGGTCD